MSEECKGIEGDPIYIDPRGKLKEGKWAGPLQTLVDYDEIGLLAQIAADLNLEYL